MLWWALFLEVEYSRLLKTRLRLQRPTLPDEKRHMTLAKSFAEYATQALNNVLKGNFRIRVLRIIIKEAACRDSSTPVVLPETSL